MSEAVSVMRFPLSNGASIEIRIDMPIGPEHLAEAFLYLRVFGRSLRKRMAVQSMLAAQALGSLCQLPETWTPAHREAAREMRTR